MPSGELCFYILRMYEFSHRVGQTRSFGNAASMSGSPQSGNGLVILGAPAKCGGRKTYAKARPDVVLARELSDQRMSLRKISAESAATMARYVERCRSGPGISYGRCCMRAESVRE